MSTLEAQRFKSKRDELIFNRKKEQMKKQQLVYDYRLQVTSNIMDNVSDIGVTVFMPHTLDEELLTNVIDAAAPIHMQMKTSVVTEITREDLDMVNFDNENLSPLLFNHIVNQEVLIVAWKMASGELRPVDGMINYFIFMYKCAIYHSNHLHYFIPHLKRFLVSSQYSYEMKVNSKRSRKKVRQRTQTNLLFDHNEFFRSFHLNFS